MSLTWRAAAVVGALLLTTSCRAEREAPPPETTRADTPRANSGETSAAAVGRCGDAVHVAVLKSDAGAGQRTTTFALTNDGPAPCTIAGRAQLEARTGDAATDGVHMGGMKVTYAMDPTVTLAAGAQATFGVSYTGIPATDRPCIDADSLRITLPGASRATTLPLRLHLCAERVLHVTAIAPRTPP